jgi:hypothetical protein
MNEHPSLIKPAERGREGQTEERQQNFVALNL